MVRYIPQRFFFLAHQSSLKLLFSSYVLYSVWKFCSMSHVQNILKCSWHNKFTGKCLLKDIILKMHKNLFSVQIWFLCTIFFIPFVNNSYAEVSIKDNRRRENCFWPPILPRHGGSGEERACPPIRLKFRPRNSIGAPKKSSVENNVTEVLIYLRQNRK
jgi:hypothetical protein